MASIRKRGERWQVRVTVGSQSVSKSFLTKVDAQKWARQQQVDLERGVIQPQSQVSITLAQLLERYIDEVLPLKRGYQQEFYILSCWQKRDLAKMQLHDIKPADIAKARDQRLEEVSSGSVRREFDAISSVFTYAVKEWGLCSSNPVKQIRKPPHGKPRERRVELDEVTRIIAASKAPDFAAIVWLAYETAMRRSELLSLVWEHIDLERRIAHLPLTKNGDSRTVPLSSTAISILSKLPRRSDGKVFSKNATSLSGAFNRAATRARSAYVAECQSKGIEAFSQYLVDIRLHDLRHAATTRYVEKGFSILEVSAITGHRSLAMLKRYSHPSAEILALKLG